MSNNCKRRRLSAAPSRLGGAQASKAAPLRRGSAQKRGYTHAWDKASKAFLAAHPLCRGCKAMGRVEPSILTDHVIPHRGDQRQFWDREWWQASCGWHHSTVKQRLEAEFDAGKILAEDLWLDSDVAVTTARHLQAQASDPGGIKSL